MVVIEGKYDLTSSDNFEQYMSAVGVGFATRKIAANLKPTTIISKDGEEYRIKTESTFKNTEIKFKLGEEFEEETADGRKCKSVITMENDSKMKHVQKVKGSDTELIMYREFTDDGMTLKLHAGDVSATRIYKKS